MTESERVQPPDGGTATSGDASPTERVSARQDVTRRTRGRSSGAKQRRRSPSAARASPRNDDQYARLFHASPDPIAVIKLLDGRVLEANPAFERLFQCPRDATIDRTMQELGLFPSRADHETLLEMVQTRGVVINIELELRSKGGEPRYCHISAAPIDFDEQPCAVLVIGDVAEHWRAEETLRETNAVLSAITLGQTNSLADADPREVFDGLLSDLLAMTGSEYGFIGEVLHDERSQPYLRTFAITNIAWNAETQALYEKYAASGFEFRNLKTLFGAVLTSGQAVIANDPAHDPRRGGLPPGHPPLNRFLGLPLYHAGKLLGMAGVANRPSVYDHTLVVKLEPFLNTCGAIIQFYRSNREREQMETTLRENQAMLAAAQRLLSLGSWEKDLDDLDNLFGNPLRWSDETFRIFGFEPGEIEVTSDNFFRAVHPDDRQRVRESDLKAVRDATRYSHEYRVVRPDGSIRYVSEVSEIIRDERTGRPLKIIGTAADVTERRRAEEQNRLAAQVFESSHGAIMITDARRVVVSVNRAFTEITGYSAEEIIGKDARMLGAGNGPNSVYDEIWTAVSVNGYWQGELWARRKSGESYPQWLSITAILDEDSSAKNYIWMADDITERKLAQERIHYLAHYDALTDLPNRTLLRDRLSQAVTAAGRNHDNVAVLFLDLDRFKNINDSLGHHIGDQLLQGVAGRLRSCVREMDTVARLGGDEFVIVLPGSGGEGASQVARKVLAAVAQPYQVENHSLTVTPSVGISIFPQDGQDIDTLIRNADAALYHAKDLGRNNHQFFAHAMNAAALERMSLENGLRVAIEQQQFLLHFQPQFDTRSGRIVGIEALVRWRHPQWGLVSPGRFIPVAEDTGLIIPLGRWILEEACRQNRAWQEAGAPSVPIAVNLSALQFRQKDFKEVVRATLQATKLGARYLELELTESIIMHEAETTIADLNELHELGVQISVDDFGTGYSSLSYLKRFPIDKLKVDQSFVRDVTTNPDDAAIVRAVISLAHSMRVTVVAEGVETQEQCDFLLSESCDQVQGYYFARPMPAPELTTLLLAPAAHVPSVSWRRGR